MDYQFYRNGEKIEVKAERNGGSLTVSSADGSYTYDVSEIGNGFYVLRRGTANFRVRVLKVKSQIFVLTDDESYAFDLPSSKDSDTFGAEHGEHGDKSKVFAPMPGKVVKVLVQAGDVVVPKQRLLIVEAMKMENPLVAPFQAKVVKVNCSEGELVDSESVLIELGQLA